MIINKDVHTCVMSCVCYYVSDRANMKETKSDLFIASYINNLSFSILHQVKISTHTLHIPSNVLQTLALKTTCCITRIAVCKCVLIKSKN